jgi:DNA-binding MarR family transcriptional regulator
VPTKTPPLTEAEVAARLRVSATRLARRLRKESTGGLTPSQISALVAISTHGPLTLGELADHERVAPPSITKAVAKLESDGLVVREADPSDRRVHRVSTTAAAEALLAENRQRKTAWLATRIHQLAPEEQARLIAALDVLDHLNGMDPE